MFTHPSGARCYATALGWSCQRTRPSTSRSWLNLCSAVCDILPARPQSPPVGEILSHPSCPLPSASREDTRAHAKLSSQSRKNTKKKHFRGQNGAEGGSTCHRHRHKQSRGFVKGGLQATSAFLNWLENTSNLKENCYVSHMGKESDHHYPGILVWRSQLDFHLYSRQLRTDELSYVPRSLPRRVKHISSGPSSISHHMS